MATGTNSRYFFYAFVISLASGGCLFCVFLIDWWLSPEQQHGLLFGTAMLFGGIANSLAFLVFHRMSSAGFEVDIWRWPMKDFRLYSKYWRIAPLRGWSRWVLAGAFLSFGLAAAFLLSSVWT